MKSERFEWDDAKAAVNAAKHRVSFEQAQLVFDDIFAIEKIDDEASYREQRVSVVGMSGARLLQVAYTMRGDRIRIISARGAEPYEKRLYHNQKA